MRALMTAFALAIALPVAGCSDSDAARPTHIPLTIKAPDKAHVFSVEVARTPEEQAKGLMFRTSLPADGGMLFPFEKPRFASFWMKNTMIPLDMFFIRADGSIDRIAENTIPENLEPVVSGGEVTAVLELAGGTAARLGIDEAAVVTWNDK
jgi:hypothetical protein